MRTTSLLALLVVALWAPRVEAQSHHVALLRGADGTHLAARFARIPARGARLEWSERCVLPCTVHASQRLAVQLESLDGEARARVPRDLDPYLGGEHLARFESHERERALGYVLLVLAGVLAAATLVTLVVMIVDGAAHAITDTLNGLGSTMPPPRREEPMWMLAPMATVAAGLCITGVIVFDAAGRDVVELRRVGPL